MSDSYESCLEDLEDIIAVFNSAGFVINMKKSVLVPTHCIQFLGVLINSLDMTFGLNEEKIQGIHEDAVSLLQAGHVTPRMLAHFIGVINSVKLSLSFAALHIRSLQQSLISAVVNLGWDGAIQLSEEAHADLRWWTENVRNVSFAPIHPQSPSFSIETDASMQGWGARWESESTGGTWTQKDLEESPHINSLELKAAFLAIQSFFKEKTECCVQIRMDNNAAVAYINHLGGTRSKRLNKYAIMLWNWCLERHIWLKADHIPGKSNVLADWESRHAHDSSDWKLKAEVAQMLFNSVLNCTVDLFASRTNNQLPVYWSRRPDPHSKGVNAFSANWKEMTPYIFPPFCMIGRCLQKVLNEKCQALIIAPSWSNQPWYPQLLRMLFQRPILLPPSLDLILDPAGQQHKLITSLQLAAWPVTGKLEQTTNFLQKLTSCSQTQSDQDPGKHIYQPGKPLIAGEVNCKTIWFQSIFPL